MMANGIRDWPARWALDALINGLGDGLRVLFKGGTSLSKAFGLIQRFSEDIDVTVFRDDLGIPASVDELAALSGKKRSAALDAIREACEAYINGPLAERLATICAETCARAGLGQGAITVKADAHNRQTLLLGYPSVTPTDAYIAKSVKIESGGKSALDPSSVWTITPYVDADVPGIDLAVPGITVVDAERTFWDKVVIFTV
jgi:Nucleotidyl transferase AbiEii toxin, Type IV TA system